MILKILLCNENEYVIDEYKNAKSSNWSCHDGVFGREKLNLSRCTLWHLYR